MNQTTEGAAVTMDIKKILAMLPHRYPFILIDRVLAIVPGEKITALKNVTINEPFFQGHFPGEPIMPGVLILEGMAQAGGLLAYQSIPEMIGVKLIYFAGMDGVRFRKTVVPGDQIIFEMEVLKQKGKIWKMAGRALVDGQLAAEAELMAAFA